MGSLRSRVSVCDGGSSLRPSGRAAGKGLFRLALGGALACLLGCADAQRTDADQRSQGGGSQAGASGASRPPGAVASSWSSVAPAPPQASAPLGPQVPDAPASNEARVVSNDGAFLVLYRFRPAEIPLNEPFAVEFRLFDDRRGQAQISDARVHVDAAMPEHRHGMNVVPRVWSNNDGSYTATGMVFHMPGRWELYFDITRGVATERAQVELWLD